MPVVPTTSGRQVQSRGISTQGFSSFQTPNVGDVLGDVAEQYACFCAGKTACECCYGSGCFFSLSQISSDLLNNPETGLLNLKGKNAIGKGQSIRSSLMLRSNNWLCRCRMNRLVMLSCSRRSSSAFSSLRRPGGNEIGQINAYEEGQFQATLLNNGKMPQHCMATTPHTYWLISKLSSKLRITALHMAGVTSKSRPKKIEFKEATAKATAQNAIEQTIFR